MRKQTKSTQAPMISVQNDKKHITSVRMAQIKKRKRKTPHVLPQYAIKAKVTATAGITRTEGLIGVSGYSKLEVLRAIQKQSRFNVIWYSIFFPLAIACLIAFGIVGRNPMVYLSVAELMVFMVASNFVARGKVVGIYINIADCVLYSLLCVFQGLYGEVIRCMLISMSFNIYGIYSWGKKDKVKTTKHKKDLHVKRLKPIDYLYIILAFCGGSVVMYFLLGLMDTKMLVLSSVIFTLSIISKALSMSRYIESWYLSIIGCVCSIGMWTYLIYLQVTGEGDWSSMPTMLSYIASLTNNINGIRIWNAMYRKITVNGGQYLAMRNIKINKIAKLKRAYRHLKWDKKRDPDHSEATQKVLREMDVVTRLNVS